MLEKVFNQSIKNAPPLKDMKKETIKGSIREITFYAKDLTKEKAKQNYQQRELADENFWKSCKETYYNDIKCL